MGEKKKNNKEKSYFWNAFWVTFIGLTVLVIIIEILYTFTYKVRPPSVKKHIPSVIDEREKIRRFVEERLLPKLKKLLPEVLVESSEDVERLINQKGEELYQEVNNELGIFINNYSNVEGYLDWLYGVSTDYKIIWKKLLDIINSGEDHAQAYFQEQFEKYLIPSAEFENFIETQIKPLVEQKAYEFYDELTSMLKERLKRRLLEELAYLQDQMEGLTQQIVNELISNAVNTAIDEIVVKVRPHTYKRMGVSTGAYLVAKPVLKFALKKLIGKAAVKLETKIAAKVAAKLGSKLGGKIVSSLLGIGEGIAACSPLGPLAFACGAIGGALGWVATDAVITKLDEFLTRDDARKEVLATLDKFKEETAREITDRFRNDLEASVMPLFEQAKQQVNSNKQTSANQSYQGETENNSNYNESSGNTYDDQSPEYAEVEETSYSEDSKPISSLERDTKNCFLSVLSEYNRNSTPPINQNLCGVNIQGYSCDCGPYTGKCIITQTDNLTVQCQGKVGTPVEKTACTATLGENVQCSGI